jgi:hypothetical protein
MDDYLYETVDRLANCNSVAIYILEFLKFFHFSSHLLYIAVMVKVRCPWSKPRCGSHTEQVCISRAMRITRYCTFIYHVSPPLILQGNTASPRFKKIYKKNVFSCKLLRCRAQPYAWLVIRTNGSPEIFTTKPMVGSLFYEVFSVNRLHSVVDMVINEWWWIGKDLVICGCSLISRYYPGIRMEGLKKTTKTHSISIAGRRDRNLKPGPPKYEEGVLNTRPRRSMQLNRMQTKNISSPIQSVLLGEVHELLRSIVCFGVHLIKDFSMFLQHM